MSEALSEFLAQVDARRAQVDALRPLSREQALTLGSAWDLEMVYESNRIEGNSLTLRETEMVVARGLTISGKPLRDHLEAVNLMAAWQRVLEMVRRAGVVTEREMLELHEIVMTRIDDANAGRYRTGFVRIAGAKHVPPNAARVPELVAELFASQGGGHSLEQAALLHHGVARIHPFSDGNGRTARLVMNLVLLRAGLPPVNLSSDRRADYYAALETADGGEPEAFVRFIAEAELRELDRWLAALNENSSAA